MCYSCTNDEVKGEIEDQITESNKRSGGNAEVARNAPKDLYV